MFILYRGGKLSLCVSTVHIFISMIEVFLLQFVLQYFLILFIWNLQL